MAPRTTEETNTAPTRKTLRGVVVSAKAKDTAVVEVSRYVKHPKYKKYRAVSKKYLAHDPGNTHAVGDTVVLRECRPISKNKHFEIIKAV